MVVNKEQVIIKKDGEIAKLKSGKKKKAKVSLPTADSPLETRLMREMRRNVQHYYVSNEGVAGII
jgi:hypothetical protein